MAASIKRIVARELLKLLKDPIPTIPQKIRIAVLIREMVGVQNSEPNVAQPEEEIKSVFDNPAIALKTVSAVESKDADEKEKTQQ